MNDIMPNALRLAAAGCDDPKWIGEIMIALCGKKVPGLDRGQRVVLSMCRSELIEAHARREAAAERKRRSRNGGAR